MLSVLICFCGVLVSLAGDYFLKTSPEFGFRSLIGSAFYASSSVAVWFLYKRCSWLYVMLLWGVLMSIGVAWIGLAVLKEKLSAQKCFAFLLGIGALVLWNWGAEGKP